MTGTAYCFDLDDTLYDYQSYAASGLRAAADWLEERTGQSYHEELREMYFCEGVTERTFDRLVDRHSLPQGIVDDLVDAFHTATDPLEPYPDTEPVLSRLADDHALGILTDGRGGREKLERLGLAEYFDAVLVTHSIDRSKPDPVVFRRLLLALGVEPRNAVYVGDDPRVDIHTPNTLGMTTVRVRRGRQAELETGEAVGRADVEIDRIGELLDFEPDFGPSSRVDRTLPSHGDS